MLIKINTVAIVHVVFFFILHLHKQKLQAEIRTWVSHNFIHAFQATHQTLESSFRSLFFYPADQPEEAEEVWEGVSHHQGAAGAAGGPHWKIWGTDCRTDTLCVLTFLAFVVMSKTKWYFLYRKCSRYANTNWEIQFYSSSIYLHKICKHLYMYTLHIQYIKKYNASNKD